MLIKSIFELELDYFAKERYKLFDLAWRGILPDSWLDRITIQSTKDSLMTFIDKGYKLYMCFADDGLPCGYVMFGKFRENSNPTDGEIMSIYFFKEYHGNGFAKELFEFAENELKKGKYKRIYIWVLEINARARRFYEKNGYSDTGERRFQNCDQLYNECLYIKNL